MPEPGEFLGRREEYLAWAADNPPPEGAMFCTRHWMPCPVDGKNGALASVMIAQEAIELIPDEVKVLGAGGDECVAAHAVAPAVLSVRRREDGGAMGGVLR